jgi:hypothetical protein
VTSVSSASYPALVHRLAGRISPRWPWRWRGRRLAIPRGGRARAAPRAPGEKCLRDPPVALPAQDPAIRDRVPTPARSGRKGMGLPSLAARIPAASLPDEFSITPPVVYMPRLLTLAPPAGTYPGVFDGLVREFQGRTPLFVDGATRYGRARLENERLATDAESLVSQPHRERLWRVSA